MNPGGEFIGFFMHNNDKNNYDNNNYNNNMIMVIKIWLQNALRIMIIKWIEENFVTLIKKKLEDGRRQKSRKYSRFWFS